MLLINAIQNLAINDAELEEPFLLVEGIHLAWTPTYVTSLISERFKLAMGGLEYLDLAEGRWPAVVTNANENEALEPLQILSIWHNYIGEFLFCLWLIKDNSLNIGLGFVNSIDSEGNDIVSSNSKSALYTCADGCRRSVEFSKAELIAGRELYQRLQETRRGKKLPSTMNPVEQVHPTGTVVTAVEVPALTRALYFVDSARDCVDLSVKVAHYTTCLEVLFSTDSSEISHKLAERIALFLGDTFEERKRLFDRVKRLYSVRSKVVHGDVFPQKQSMMLSNVSQDADDLLRRILRRIIDSDELRDLFEGTSDSREEYFINLVLG